MAVLQNSSPMLFVLLLFSKPLHKFFLEKVRKVLKDL